ncbi:MAG: response regulator [Gallionella sp.]|nr:response regulator [Gallionella sp.]MDD4945539.1 response regulator [Gallionella sp.]MDD5611861.1 response regulator [Gallionella sp.]
MRVLVVEDDPVLADGLIRILQRANHTVTHESSGKQADLYLTSNEYELVILDMGLPGMDGTEVLRRLRQRGNKVPVLILTARDGVEDRVRGLDYGADDYLAKPFNLPELEARIRALLRRGQSASGSVLQIGVLSLDTVGRRATLDGVPVELSGREITVLEMLMLRAGRVVSKELLSEQMSDLGEEMSTNAVEVYVHRLRKKIESEKVNIRTLRGMGYMLEKS